jgi:hypothetical protein
MRSQRINIRSRPVTGSCPTCSPSVFGSLCPNIGREISYSCTMTPARSPVIRAERVAAGTSKRKSDAPRLPRRRVPQFFTNHNTSMSPSKDTSSHRRKSDPSIDPMGDDLPKEICSRVRKACNRCRLRKVKCNGRIPCARCEQDHATCKINYDVTGIKDLRKRYAELLLITHILVLMLSSQLHCLSGRATNLLAQCP